jgi:two-component system chemotaxis sensor kinase CheA
VNDLRQKLLATFQAECGDHLRQLRALLPAVDQGGGLDEIFRRAHSLKGAARAVDLRPVEQLAHCLETLFSRAREGRMRVEGEGMAAALQALDAIEDWVGALGKGEPPPDPAGAQEALERVLGLEPAPPVPSQEAAPSFQPVETLRVRAENLDRLFRSAGQLLEEGLRQEALGRQLGELGRCIAELERAWAQVRRDAPSLPGLSLAERHLRLLAGQGRAARLAQQKSAHALRQLGEQLREEVRRARLVPASGICEGFSKMVRDLAREEGKEVAFQAAGLEVEADRLVLQALKDPLMHLLRNAVSHGIETPRERLGQGKSPQGQVRLRLETQGNRLRVAVEDDGRGIDLERVAEVALQRGILSAAEAAALPPQELRRLVLRPGFSTSRALTEVSGRGMGLSVVHEAATRLQGEVELRPGPGTGTAVLLSVPLSIATHRLLLVRCQGQRFGLPVHGIERLHRIAPSQVESVEGRPALRLGERLLPFAGLGRLLGLGEAVANGETLPVALLKSGEERLALAVDEFLSVREGLLQEVEAPPPVAGGFLLEEGSVCLALNPLGLFEAFRGAGELPLPAAARPAPAADPPAILVVDDSITTRTLEKSLLEAHGYRVRVAVDGVEALERLNAGDIDLVVADLQMPRMDGFALMEAMKADPRLARLPVVLVTSMENRRDQERGLALGARAYIVKRKFDQRELLDTIEQLL